MKLGTVLAMLAGAAAGYFGGLHAIGWFVLGEIVMGVAILID